MTPVPPPASPCLRVRLLYTQTDSFDSGSRFYLSYAGSAPTAGNCSTIASDIASAFSSHLATTISPDWALTEIDVLDIATDSGNSGQWTGSEAGTATGTSLPAQCATNIEFQIARRYRGGKPRMYLPPNTTSNLQDQGHYTNAFCNAINTDFAAFMTAVEAISVGAVGALQHVNLSYYSGFTNVTNSSGRERAVPKYRTAARVDTVTGYSCKPLIGSQRRRRNATSP